MFFLSFLIQFVFCVLLVDWTCEGACVGVCLSTWIAQTLSKITNKLCIVISYHLSVIGYPLTVNGNQLSVANRSRFPHSAKLIL